MLTQLRKFPAMLFALVALAAIGGCNTNDDPVDPNGTKPGTPSALRAQSRSETSVGLKWDAPASGVTPTGYRIYYNEVGNSTKTAVDVTGASTTSGVVNSLDVGKVYEFTVQAMNGTVQGDPTASMSWAPAHRSGNIKMYSYLNTANGSGLIVFDGNPRDAKIAQGDQWDLAFDDKENPAQPKICSPGFAKGYVDQTTNRFFANDLLSRVTYLGRQYTNVNNLDEIFESEDLNDAKLEELKEAAYDLSTVGGTGGLAFVFAHKNSPVSFTYGKILVIRNGSLVQGSDPNKFIEVVVSYQTSADIPYALRQKLDILEAKTMIERAAQVK